VVGLKNALLIELAIGTGIYSAWNNDLVVGIVSIGLAYKSYKLIRKSL
jgi:hypothetical protein